MRIKCKGDKQAEDFINKITLAGYLMATETDRFFYTPKDYRSLFIYREEIEVVSICENKMGAICRIISNDSYVYVPEELVDEVTKEA